MGEECHLLNAFLPGAAPLSVFFHCIFKFFISLALLCGMLDSVPQAGIKPMSPAVEAQSPNHWTAREVLPFSLYTPFS